MKSKNNSDIDQEQIELLEYAQSRIKQKKNLYYHFVLFLFISIISLTLNHIFSISNNISFLNYSWSFWLIFSWFFLFLFHVFNVYVTNRFMSKSWVRKQKSNLIKLQKLKIENQHFAPKIWWEIRDLEAASAFHSEVQKPIPSP